MHMHSRRSLVHLALAGIFITNALLGELMGGKLITLGPFTMSIGVIPWPVVFLTTDLINEYFGREGVRRLTLMTSALIVFAFVVLYVAMHIPAADFSPVNDQAFNMVFGQSLWIIVGSLVAFMASQLVDVMVFWILRSKTQGRLLWLRATGSTVVSQLIDTFLILGIAFWLPGKLNTEQYLLTSVSNYTYKLAIALLLTPLIYLGHSLIHKYLGDEESKKLTNEAAHSSA